MTSCDQGHGKLVSCISANFGEGTSCATDVQQNSSGLAQVAEISCFLVIFLFWEDPTVPLWLLKLFPCCLEDSRLTSDTSKVIAFLSQFHTLTGGGLLCTSGLDRMMKLWRIKALEEQRSCAKAIGEQFFLGRNLETSMRHLWDIRHLKTFEAKEIPESCCFQTRDSGDIEPIELISQMPQTPKVPQWGESNLLHPKKSEKC